MSYREASGIGLESASPEAAEPNCGTEADGCSGPIATGPSSRPRFGELVGGSPRMREALAVLERVARSGEAALIEGESGTGKELAARALHAASGRTGPCVVLDCAALASDDAESELFGANGGVFSGTSERHAGAFQRADGGSVFLDEIGALPLSLQPKLLSMLESGTPGPAGPELSRKLDVRVIATTNRDLSAAVRRGTFRAALLRRLEGAKIRLPPLRERLEDLPALVEQLSRGRLAQGEPLSGDNLTRLTSHTWPGNVRELREVLERAFERSGRKDGIRFSELVLSFAASDPESSSRPPLSGVTLALPFKQAKERLLRDFENAYLEALLAAHEGNLSRAAAAAGISRKHIYALLRRAGRSQPAGADE